MELDAVINRMALVTPRGLLIAELNDLYSAANQLLKVLPQILEAAASEELRRAFKTHVNTTQAHIARLEQIGQQLGASMQSKKCKAVERLVAEAKDVIKGNAEPTLRDLAVIGATQKVEHYGIAGYGAARTLAELIGEDEIAKILQATLEEEGNTDRLLTEIAMELNVDASVDTYIER